MGLKVSQSNKGLLLRNYPSECKTHAKSGLTAWQVISHVGIVAKKLLGVVDRRRYPRTENRVGATRKTSRREDRRIVRQALVDPTVTRSTIRADASVAIIRQTISRHLSEANLKSKRAFRALPLTPEHRLLRLQWSQARSLWNVTDWQKVVFSDESRFVLGTDDNRVWVWRRLGERYNSPPKHCSTSHCPHSWCNGLMGAQPMIAGPL
ncbi:transposable element Tc1 transposase [Trichonephila clavipes]|nr:transposable element Tc1 transposase [Trichonephila clavipes]